MTTISSVDERTRDRLTTHLKSRLFEAGQDFSDRVEDDDFFDEVLVSDGTIAVKITASITGAWKPVGDNLNLQMVATVRSVINMAIGRANWKEPTFKFSNSEDEPIRVTIIAEQISSS